MDLFHLQSAIQQSVIIYLCNCLSVLVIILLVVGHVVIVDAWDFEVMANCNNSFSWSSVGHLCCVLTLLLLRSKNPISASVERKM